MFSHFSHSQCAGDRLRRSPIKDPREKRKPLLSPGQVTDYVPHQRHHLEQGGHDSQHGRSQPERKVNRQKERSEINGSERKSLLGKQMLQMRHESPEEVEGGNDEERAEGEEKREFPRFDQQHGQVKRRHTEADRAADQAQDEAVYALLAGQPTRVLVVFR